MEDHDDVDESMRNQSHNQPVARRGQARDV